MKTIWFLFCAAAAVTIGWKTGLVVCEAAGIAFQAAASRMAKKGKDRYNTEIVDA